MQRPTSSHLESICVQVHSRPQAASHAVRRSCYFVAGCMLLSGLSAVSLGDTLSSESSVGLSSEYSSNPFLVSSGARAAESIALLANLPATYTSDTQTFDFVPRLRFAETHGDVALLSDYQYLDATWRVNSERNTFTANADWHHDSTLYNVFENAELFGRSLHRQEEIGNLNWKRDLSERSDLQLRGSWDQVAFSQSANTGLANFHYGQGLVQYDRALNERWQWTSAIGFGRFELLNHSYRSDNRFIQTALNRALSERWSVMAQVGYSLLSAHQQGLICCQFVAEPNGLPLQSIPFSQTTSHGTGSYALTFERKSERLVIDLAASRAIQPSGLGALVTQDDESLKASIPWTERWTLAAMLHAAQLTDSLHTLNLADRRYGDFDLSSNWLWTEHWTLQLQAAYILQRRASGVPTSSGVTVYLNLLRQFGRIRL
jgi:hypothetical protein